MDLDRKLNSLEVLLLVLVKAGLSTTYQLMTQAGMSAGLAGPALRRMKASKLVTHTSGPRNVVRYAITKEGEKIIQESVASSRACGWLPESHTAFESGARNALLALIYEGHSGALNSVDSATEALKEQSRRKKREAADLHESVLSLNKRFFENEAACDRGILIATAYRWMKTTSSAALFELQAEAMRTLVPLISELPAATGILIEPEPLTIRRRDK
jgi:DNA-binding PadR family transcriptional regulator